MAKTFYLLARRCNAASRHTHTCAAPALLIESVAVDSKSLQQNPSLLAFAMLNCIPGTLRDPHSREATSTSFGHRGYDATVCKQMKGSANYIRVIIIPYSPRYRAIIQLLPSSAI